VEVHTEQTLGLRLRMFSQAYGVTQGCQPGQLFIHIFTSDFVRFPPVAFLEEALQIAFTVHNGEREIEPRMRWLNGFWRSGAE